MTAEDGDLKVVGKCSDGQEDHDGDIVSPAWMAVAVKDFLATYPAIRVQHRPDRPAGKGLEAWQDESGATWLKALIVEEAAKKMVRKQILRAYSIGVAQPDMRKTGRCRRAEIVGGRLAEVSLVDSPSNARAGITVCKGGQYIGKAWKTPKLTKSEKRVMALIESYEMPDDTLSAHRIIEGYRNSSDPQTREMARAWYGR